MKEIKRVKNRICVYCLWRKIVVDENEEKGGGKVLYGEKTG